MDIFSMMEGQLGVFLLIFTRVSGMFVTAPVFGSRNLPVYAKAGLALALTYILFPLFFNTDIQIPDAILPYSLLVLKEFVVGLLLGFVSSMVFYTVQMSGHLLDMQIGFGIVNTIDPTNGQQIPLVGNFKYILALLIFLAINGHHVLLAALFSSFKMIPLTQVILHNTLADIFVDIISQSFVIAFKICIPVIVALLLMDIALGILARTMPQMNIFVVGIPGKIIIGVFVLSLALPFYILFLEVAFNGMYSDIYRILSNLS
ncbi:flagellar biosynthetic protein FliR [Propionispora sp. 2/2-37]|uniref:flagellar biosynthetic protein FliR n=1 Tax=Propionispora sp. 2/2-37 TaxID=1677858 RepID=UPI0006BB7154|nr:flagellar biosynthetic protein FliR [Propionispora sp. 2/2-37]